nr:MAG TPA: hypothetical protein [Bacteriophage sp.]
MIKTLMMICLMKLDKLFSIIEKMKKITFP